MTTAAASELSEGSAGIGRRVGGVGSRQRRSTLRMRQIVVSYALKEHQSMPCPSTAHVGTAENSSTLEFSSFARRARFRGLGPAVGIFAPETDQEKHNYGADYRTLE